MPLEHYFTNNPNLKSELRKLTYNYKDVHFEFFSDNGVFSKNKVDFASKLLVETFLDTTRDVRDFKMLDVGCGYGFLGIVISKILNVDIELVDVNKRALHLSERNIKLNEVKGRAYESNAYECVKNKYDYIITNPPIRAGKDTVRKFLIGSYDYLKEQGKLYFVMRKDHGVKSMIKEMSSLFEVNIINKDKGFYIVLATKR